VVGQDDLGQCVGARRRRGPLGRGGCTEHAQRQYSLR
jgi:hypothetical protein